MSDHAADLKRFLSKRRILESDIKDICQEVYLRLLRFERREVIHNPVAYLFRVAANVAHDFRLLQARYTGLDVETLERLDPSPAADQLVELDHRHRALRAALQKLSAVQRAAVLLRVHEGLSYHEIAEQLGVSQRVVKRAIVRGHAALRQHLAGDV
jgi:RNA polymerase sigma-70 factor (ECF subfamily)